MQHRHQSDDLDAGVEQEHEMRPATPLAPAEPAHGDPVSASKSRSFANPASAHALKLVRSGCLVVPLGGDRPLARACVELLETELPALRPTLDSAPGGVDVIWVCGYRPGARSVVERLRAEHPDAHLVVTGREVDADRQRLQLAGADEVLGWPLSMGELSEALGARRARA
ncbi:MAG: hypothetical protein AAFZ65_08335 [Planctomycetota bacterium]